MFSLFYIENHFFSQKEINTHLNMCRKDPMCTQWYESNAMIVS